MLIKSKEIQILYTSKLNVIMYKNLYSQICAINFKIIFTFLVSKIVERNNKKFILFIFLWEYLYVQTFEIK